MFALVSGASAQAPYPNRTITLVLPFAAGSGTDTTTRLISKELGVALGVGMVVDNKAGANGSIAASYAARSTPDGYTLFVTTNTTHSANPYLLKTLSYDPIKDFTPIARIGSFASFVAVTPDKPYQSMQALVDFAKANPGKLSYGVGNSTSQIVGEALKKRTGTDIVRVPYRSNPAVVTDLLGGQIQIMIADFNTGMTQLKAGKVSALAVLTRNRNPALPDVPTLSETVMPGYHILAWAGMFGPAGMPPEAVKVLADAVQKALDNPEVRKRFAGAGTDVYWSGPQQFAEFVKTELVSWTAMIKEAGIEPE
jgi:tripartite-type tricarboxylate transporter receptor subunit TctC